MGLFNLFNDKKFFTHFHERLEKHINSLIEFSDLPGNYVWQRNKILKFKHIDESLITDLIELHRNHIKQHDPTSNAENIDAENIIMSELLELHKDILSMLAKRNFFWVKRRAEKNLIHKLLEDLKSLINDKENERRRLLEQWGVAPNDFLVHHWAITVKMLHSNAADGPTIMNYLINSINSNNISEEIFPFIVELVQLIGYRSNELFNAGFLNYMENIIGNRVGLWKLLIEVVKEVGGSEERYELCNGFLNCKDIITNNRIFLDVIRMVKTLGKDGVFFMQYGLQSLRGNINSKTWQLIVHYAPAFQLHIKSRLGFIPKSLFVDFISRLRNAGSFNEFTARLNQRILFIKKYFEEVGFTVYTEKIISENFWNFDYNKKINRLKFEKTGSELIPLGGKFKTKFLIRVIERESYETWKRAQDEGLPVEEIVRAYPTKHGKVRVYCREEGESLLRYQTQHPDLAEDLDLRWRALQELFRKHNIEHGHLHKENITVKVQGGKLVLKVIDFDQSISTI